MIYHPQNFFSVNSYKEISISLSLDSLYARDLGGTSVKEEIPKRGLYRDILAEFPGVTADRPKPNSKPAHGVYHHIQTTGPPVYAKARRLDPDKLVEAKAEFDRMEAAGIVRRSDSAWASPLHMVRKADNSWRPCGDFRRLNTVTKPDRYPVPNMQDLTARLHGSTIFSKLDLKKGYQ